MTASRRSPLGKIDIDVRPGLFGLRSENVRREIEFERIDRGNAEAKTDRAVGRAAAALHHDVVLAAEIDDVPNDQKITGEPELFDQREFLLDLTRTFGLIAA